LALFVGLPAFHLFFVLMLILALGDRQERWQPDRRRVAPQCVVCGYDVLASKSRCPECGTAIPPPDPLAHSPMLVRVLEHAESFARETGLDYVGTEHVLLAMFGEPESVAGVVLADLGVEEGEVREHIAAVNNFVLPID
jgi:ATP-dependent Clp protease ATP-binding subunit ClpA